jgi:hypothetical protein
MWQAMTGNSGIVSEGIEEDLRSALGVVILRLLIVFRNLSFILRKVRRLYRACLDMPELSI